MIRIPCTHANLSHATIGVSGSVLLSLSEVNAEGSAHEFDAVKLCDSS